MDLQKLGCNSIFRHSVLFLVFITSPEVFAISDYIESQGPDRITALIYGLLGVMTLLFITPFLQFHFSAVRTRNHQKERDQLARSSAENETLKNELQAIKVKLLQVEKSQSTVKSESCKVADDNNIAVLKKQYDAAQSEISALLSQLDSLKQRVYEKDQSIGVLDHQLNLLEAEQENATGFINQLTEQLAAQNKAIAIAEERNLALTKSGDADAIAVLQSQLDQLTSNSMLEKDRLLKEKAAINDELACTKLDLNKARQQARELSQISQQLDLENKQQAEMIDNLMAQVSPKK